MRDIKRRGKPFNRIVYTVFVSPAESAALDVLAELEGEGTENTFLHSLPATHEIREEGILPFRWKQCTWPNTRFRGLS